MLVLDIPGYETIKVKNIVFDFNGTLAVDGVLVAGVNEKITALSERGVHLYVLTADTFGTAVRQCQNLPLDIHVFSQENISANKMQFVQTIGPETTITVGNGRNDLAMFEKSILSICIIGSEGCCAKSMNAADIIVSNPLDALELLLKNDRIVATLRT
ncbi:HAD family hydrolase [Acetobacterium tundrae]|uniref:ATPase P n=1 Tax=Acetobacterium tundrae TaxID=132932 RepID=A0ABR6WI83_9FIRM|nr:HAD family hydrolase [Acetobacterium tundrae]MBC3796171.1 ATPase P [Acetobacterium tundrae]